MKKIGFFLILNSLWLVACTSYRPAVYDFPTPVDTQTRPIQLQEKQVFAFPEAGVYADNRFAGARLNEMHWLPPDTLRAVIFPENSPINPSAYYAFKLWSEAEQALTLELNYGAAFHRYWPKKSTDGAHWQPVDSALVGVAPDSSKAWIRLELGPDPVWIAAQEIHTSADVAAYCSRHSWHPAVTMSVIDTSRLGRDLLCLDINEGAPKGKDIVVLFSRQHPPEVTGYLALEAFVDELLDSNPLSDAFRKKYRVLVYPLLNPDGVDLGHWRHNAGGVDLNRDWAYYRQPETQRVAAHVVRTSKKAKSRVILGLDFHSTWYDIYYTPDTTVPSALPGFATAWLQGIDAAIPDYSPKEDPGPIARPTSDAWFATQFGATGITFELGDDTPRPFIREKGRVAAQEMMRLLLLEK